MGAGIKRNTLFQESLCRLRNCHPSLGWSVKSKHLTKFSNTMRVSGYGAEYRHDIIKGAVDRHKEMLRKSENGEIKLYRSRKEIKLAKREKGGGGQPPPGT